MPAPLERRVERGDLHVVRPRADDVDDELAHAQRPPSIRAAVRAPISAQRSPRPGGGGCALGCQRVGARRPAAHVSVAASEARSPGSKSQPAASPSRSSAYAGRRAATTGSPARARGSASRTYRRRFAREARVGGAEELGHALVGDEAEPGEDPRIGRGGCPTRSACASLVIPPVTTSAASVERGRPERTEQRTRPPCRRAGRRSRGRRTCVAESRARRRTSSRGRPSS